MERWVIYGGMWAIVLTLLYISHKVYESLENEGSQETGPTNN